jgi:arginine-tRNA-protein transferase
MKHRLDAPAQFFFVTTPLPCPYRPGKFERRLVTDLSGRAAVELHDLLSQAGFRRSHNIAYVPVCRDCSACAAVRTQVSKFVANRTQRRIWSRNQDLTAELKPSHASSEQFTLFRAYQRARHAGGEMSKMDYHDFQAMLEETPVKTALLSLRDPQQRLVGVCLTDQLSDGLSAVYSYFDPEQPQRSLGTLMILHLIERARHLNLPFVYLGFWIKGSEKMGYKSKFRPLEAFTPDGWKTLDVTDTSVMQYFSAT